MTDRDQRGAAQALMHEMRLDDSNIDRRKHAVGLEAADLPRIAAVKDLVIQRADAYTAAFFEHLGRLEEARAFIASSALVDRARQLKRAHLAEMVSGNYGPAYVEQRVELALLYANGGLEPRAFLGAFDRLLRDVGVDIMKQAERTPLEGFDNFMSLRKIAFFDISVIVDVLVFERERVIRQQHEAIRELSTPVLQIRDRLLLLPIIGVIDTHRARLVTEGLLRSIRINRAKVVVMDVTGVATIDSKVANHLLQTVMAARLMGAHVIVTGLSADVAQSLVALGIELSKVNTVGDLQGGVEEAERILGYRVLQLDSRGESAGRGD
jgi:rsbT co-antagonist protein RsbR